MEKDLRAAMAVVLNDKKDVLILKRMEAAGWMPG